MTHQHDMIAAHEQTIRNLTAALPQDEPELAELITQLRAQWNRIQASESGQPLADAYYDLARWHEREARAYRRAASGWDDATANGR